MGRRTNAQICIDLKKERSKLYRERTTILKNLMKPKFTGSKREKAEKRYKSIQNKLISIKDRLFRCGTKFSDFKKQRTKLRKHQYYLQSKIEKLRVKIADPSLSKKERKALNKELNIVGVFKRKTAEKIHLIEKAMKLPVGTIASSRGVDTGVVAVTGGKFVVQDIIWRMTEGWHKWLSSGYFDTLVIDDEIFDISENPMIATAAVYQAYDWAMAWQHVYGTPFFFAYGDAMNGYLELKVKEYTTDMYAAEIAKHSGDIAEE